jgi:nitroreductase
MIGTESRAPKGIVRAALVAAVRAPSPHNTQPWRFEVDDRRIDVFLDRDRVLPVADADGREARIACGAAVVNARVALAAAGQSSTVELVPDKENPDHLATVWLGNAAPVRPADEALCRAVQYRRTNRRPFLDRPVPARVRHAMSQAALTEGATLVLLDRPADLDRLAVLLRQAETRQSEDPAFLDELRRWTSHELGRTDGVPLAAGGPRPAEGTLLALRRYGETSTIVRPYESEPLVAVLASATDTALDHLRAGQALQRALLAATTAGVSASFLTQPVELPDSRVAVREMLVQPAHPQVVLRLGYGFATASTPRRRVEEVTRRRD